MATVIDITNKIKNEERFIKIGEKSFKVDCSKNTMISVMADFQESTGTIQDMDGAVEKLIGKAGKKAVDGMNLDLSDYQIVFIAIMAAATDSTYEDAAERFHKAGI